MKRTGRLVGFLILSFSVILVSACTKGADTSVPKVADAREIGIEQTNSAGDQEADQMASDEESVVDTDEDGVIDLKDNCVDVKNVSQLDSDGDGLGELCDNCPYEKNLNQKDNDGDMDGDVCDPDDDNDDVADVVDNCKFVYNQGQADSDGDGIGDVCDIDNDNDGISDERDNCLDVANSNQANADSDSFGDVCDEDADNDGVLNSFDNCEIVVNIDQKDTDGDGVGDVCENDIDGDGITDEVDNCGYVSNFNQSDIDGDSDGDLCDDDADSDGYLNGADNCQFVANPDQKDRTNVKGAVAYWTFDGEDLDGYNPLDIVGDNHGASNDIQIVEDGFLGGALQFNGTSSYVNVSPVNLRDAVTVSAWVKRLNSVPNTWQIVFMQGTQIELDVGNSGGLRTGISTTNRHVFNSGTGVNVGEWHHVAMTYDGINIKSYIDGVKTSTNEYPCSGQIATGAKTNIGTDLNNYYFNGIIDEVIVFDSALVDSDIEQIYNDGLAGKKGFLGNGKGDVCEE